mgnify:CR=1 FL=1
MALYFRATWPRQNRCQLHKFAASLPASLKASRPICPSPSMLPSRSCIGPYPIRRFRQSSRSQSSFDRGPSSPRCFDLLTVCSQVVLGSVNPQSLAGQPLSHSVTQGSAGRSRSLNRALVLLLTKCLKRTKGSAQPPAPRASLLPEQAAAARFCALLLDPGWLPGLGQAGQVPHPLTRAPFVPLAARLSHSAGTARAGVLLGPRLASPPSSCLPASTLWA